MIVVNLPDPIFSESINMQASSTAYFDTRVTRLNPIARKRNANKIRKSQSLVGIRLISYKMLKVVNSRICNFLTNPDSLSSSSFPLFKKVSRRRLIISVKMAHT